MHSIFYYLHQTNSSLNSVNQLILPIHSIYKVNSKIQDNSMLMLVLMSHKEWVRQLVVSRRWIKHRIYSQIMGNGITIRLYLQMTVQPLIPKERAGRMNRIASNHRVLMTYRT